MTDIAVFGTAAADIVLRVSVLPGPGDHIRAEPLGWRLGGSSANVACALAATGHDVELIGVVGTDEMAESLLRELNARGVGTTRSIRVEGRSPRALILLDPSGERSIISLDIGSVTDALPIHDLPDLGPVPCLYVESYRRFPTAIADRWPDALLVATPPDGSADQWPADIVVGSERQFPPAWGGDQFAAGRKLVGPRLRWVVITRGVGGADAYGEQETLHAPARPAKQIDATGAGDAFAGGLIHSLVGGASMRDAMDVASERGAAAVETLQSVPPAWLDGTLMP